MHVFANIEGIVSEALELMLRYLSFQPEEIFATGCQTPKHLCPAGCASHRWSTALRRSPGGEGASAGRPSTACTSKRTLAARQQRQTRLLSRSFAQAFAGHHSEVYWLRCSLAPGTLGRRCLGPLICFPLNSGGGNYSLPPRASTPTGRDGTTTAPPAGPAATAHPSHREAQVK